MKAPDPAVVSPFISDDGPVFDEPWHAQVLALADTLIAARKFSQSEWASALGGALKGACARGDTDSTETYYLCAVEALEALIAGHTPIDAPTLSARKDAWARAYLATPHGHPVHLSAGGKPG
ncbi:MAG: nitrile hydratase accessory protein [Paracoccaceae bacterium]